MSFAARQGNTRCSDMPIKLVHACKLLPNKRWRAEFILVFEQGTRRVSLQCQDSDPDRTFATEKQARRRNLALAAPFLREKPEEVGDGAGDCDSA
jgi:hypothetical protein